VDHLLTSRSLKLTVRAPELNLIGVVCAAFAWMFTQLFELIGCHVHEVRLYPFMQQYYCCMT